ncbi:response regulator [Gloeothece verrucosa]|uniref:Putative PAS/PAC sensor protein n=1 Tax=Gloeothece verrucosa (strain PCC 7822) TaxID=497965 RepID=E0UKK0_GLOV7|nr:response regulator [Gloeothece verrucosa]ADN17480.1 putative PAS/PAC sensor protein [Gloeothece verrucosa PCC 7822]
MSDEKLRQYIETLRQLIAAEEEKQELIAFSESVVALDGLQLYIEEMQTKLEIASCLEQKLIEQNQRIVTAYQHYYDLFHTSPLGYLVTDAKGLITEANQMIAKWLNVPQHYLVGKPLVVYVDHSERSAFYTKLDELSQKREIQHWQTILCPRHQEPFSALLQVLSLRNDSGSIETLRIGVHNLIQIQQAEFLIAQPPYPKAISTKEKVSKLTLSQSLNGLQVLVVDDEADAREFISAVLESAGIRVRAVASAAAALKELEQFQADVLVSDIRMPDKDGYSLIRQIRELESQIGGHIPAVAITAYLDETREKVISAGFEAHLHKLAQPRDLIDMVTQLARRTYSQ